VSRYADHPRGVLHLRASNGVYGAERVILALCEAQRQRGLAPEILCLERSPQDAFSAAARATGLPVHRVSSAGRADLGALRAIAEVLRRRRPAVLHSHGYKTDVALALLRAVGPLPPMVATNHLWTGETVSLRVYERIDALALRAFDAVVAVSREVERELVRGGVSARRVVTVVNGLRYPAPASRAAGRERLPRPARDALAVGFVGRLSPQKGLDVLVEAARRAPAALHWVLAGDGPLREGLEAAARAPALAGRLHLLGRREDVPLLLAGLDVFALPSAREGTPLALLEAMAAGVAPVASAVGGVREVVDHGRTGLLVPPGDPAALAAAVARLAGDAGLRRAMGEAAAREVRARFTDGDMERAYRAVYLAAGAALEAVPDAGWAASGGPAPVAEGAAGAVAGEAP
jgi:glycosyltransferase involved in cell wall biosynthesis